MEYKEVTNR